MKLKIISICLLFISVFISCEKNPEVLSVNPEKQLLSKVLIADKLYAEYLYNNESLVIEEKSKFDFVENNYNVKKQLVSSDYYWDKAMLSSDPSVLDAALTRSEWVNPDDAVKGLTIQYEYNAQDQLTKTTVSRPSISYSEFSEFSYDANGRVSRQTIYGENKITGYNDYLYDEKSNLVKQMLYYVTSTGETELSTITQYEFDNKQNPFKLLSNGTKPGINTNENNIIKEIYTIQFPIGQDMEQVQLTQNTYEYNTYGYPVKKNGTIKYAYN